VAIRLIKDGDTLATGGFKRLWGFGNVRYRGLQKNATRTFTKLALANSYLARQWLMEQVRPRGE
jgi:IS5 family transposase